MTDSDKHLIIQTVLSQLTEVRQGQMQIMTTVANNDKRISDLFNTLHEQAIRDKEEESNRRLEYGLAVENCKAKGVVAEEAKSIALSAKRTADKALAIADGKSPNSSKRSDRISWGAFITSLGLLINEAAKWLSNWGHH